MKKQFKFISIILGLSLALIGCSQSNEAYEQMMAKGLERIEKEEFAKAEGFFEMALEERPDDAQASILLEQTQQIQEADRELTDGNIDNASKLLGKVIKVEEGSDLLVEQAQLMREKIQALKSKESEYLASFEDAKKKLNEQAYDESIQTLETLLQQDLSHPLHTEMKKNVETFKGEVVIAKEKAVAEAKIEKEKQAELERKAAQLKAEAEKKAAELKAAEEKKAASKDIGALGGYWLNGTMACHITAELAACALANSDHITNTKIINISHLSSTEIELSFEEGSTKYDVSNKDMVKFPDGQYYKRVSKEEANAVYDGYYELP
ncbi:hypothetical protein [Bacillus sp. FSL K6-3431]|uniref:hypothetical protein n=1 Tax=Bacillus sp. FSL K6-3431 TaxID=2921500 RepID=UPI0030F70E21